MKRLLLLILSFGLIAGTAYAHNGMTHVMGKVTAVDEASISVKTADGKVQNVALTSGTTYLRGENSATIKDVKVGDHVVIHATGKPDHLVAAEVKLATIKSNDSKTGRKHADAAHWPLEMKSLSVS